MSVAGAAVASIEDSAANLPAVRAAATPVHVTLRSMITDALTWIGLGGLAPSLPIPDLPMPSFVAGLWLGVRGLQRAVNNQRPSAHPTLYDPDPDGTIRGNVNAVDFEGDPLTYSVSRASAHGTVSIAADGSFTYTPGDPIAISGGTDSFAIAIDDGASHGVLGFGAGPTIVTVAVAVDGTRTNPVVVTGSSALPGGGGLFANPLMNADGTRAVFTTSDNSDADLYAYITRVTVVDTSAGAPIAPAITIDGHLDYVVLSDDGARAIVTIQPWGSSDARVAVIDTATGAQIGATVSISSSQFAEAVLSADLTRAVLTAFDADSTTSRIAVVDLTTGVQIGSTVTVSGGRGQALTNDDGTRAVITTSDGGTRLAVFDTATGAQIGNTVTLAGEQTSAALVADGTRAVVTTTDAATGVSRVAVVDVSDGSQIGTTVSFSDSGFFTLSPDGTRATFTTTARAASGIVSRIAVVDTATGAQDGPAISFTIPYTSQTVAGYDRGFYEGPILTDDGAHAVFYSDSNSGYTNRNTARMIVVDTASGQVGKTISLAGVPAALVTPDGSRAFLAAAGRVAMVDTATGTQIGSTITVGGGLPQLWTAGNRVVIATEVGAASRLAVVDTVTGVQVGATVVVDGGAVSVVLTPDATRAFVTTYDYDAKDSRVAVIDIATGAQVGSTIVVPGFVNVIPALSADGAHAVILTTADGSDALTVTSFQIGQPKTTLT